MNSERLQRLVEQARSDPAVLHALVFGPMATGGGVGEKPDSEDGPLVRVNPDQFFGVLADYARWMSCGGGETCSCTSATCEGTCGGSTCSATCGADSCGRTCDDSCGTTTGVGRFTREVSGPIRPARVLPD